MNLGLLVTASPRAKQDDPLAAYLREKSAPAPDLESYLREKRISEMASKTGRLESFGRGAAQGATLGFGDEMAGGYTAAQKQIERMPELKGAPDAELFASGMASPDEAMAARDQSREANEAARRAHGGAYLGGELAGGALPTAAVTAATGGAAALPMSIAQGATQGLGYSNASTPRGLAGDSVLGGVLGLAGHTVGEGIGTASRGVASLARSKVAAASGRAATQAADEANAGVASLVGQYGGEAQKGHRLVENLARLEASFTPQQRVVYDQLEKSGVFQNLREQLAGHALEAAPTQAATIASKKAAAEAARSALPQTIADRTAELSKPQLLKDAASLAKSYAEPVVATMLAPPGYKEAAGLVFGRTRMGKAIANRLTRPGNQIAAFGALEKAAELPNTPYVEFLRRALLQGAVPEGLPAQ